jgi:hypothetical protein
LHCQEKKPRSSSDCFSKDSSLSGKTQRHSLYNNNNNSSAAEEEIAKQFPTELWRVLKFSMYTSILHIVVIIPVFRGGTLFQTRIIIIYMCSLLI